MGSNQSTVGLKTAHAKKQNDGKDAQSLIADTNAMLVGLFDNVTEMQLVIKMDFVVSIQVIVMYVSTPTNSYLLDACVEINRQSSHERTGKEKSVQEAVF